MIEKHYTINELCELLNMSFSRVRLLVKDEPGGAEVRFRRETGAGAPNYVTGFLKVWFRGFYAGARIRPHKRKRLGFHRASCVSCLQFSALSYRWRHFQDGRSLWASRSALAGWVRYDSLFHPRSYYRLIQVGLARANPRHVMSLGDLDRGVSEDDGDLLERIPLSRLPLRTCPGAYAGGIASRSRPSQ